MTPMRIGTALEDALDPELLLFDGRGLDDVLSMHLWHPKHKQKVYIVVWPHITHLYSH